MTVSAWLMQRRCTQGHCSGRSRARIDLGHRCRSSRRAITQRREHGESEVQAVEPLDRVAVESKIESVDLRRVISRNSSP